MENNVVKDWIIACTQEKFEESIKHAKQLQKEKEVRTKYACELTFYKLGACFIKRTIVFDKRGDAVAFQLLCETEPSIIAEIITGEASYGRKIECRTCEVELFNKNDAKKLFDKINNYIACEKGLEEDLNK